MDPVRAHRLEPDASFDGGDLDCGNGLLLLIRQHMDPLPRGGLLEFRSVDSSVEADFPAWCRMTGNELVSWTKAGRLRSFLVCKGALSERSSPGASRSPRGPAPSPRIVPITIPPSLPAPGPAPAIRPLSVMGIGSWPRPRWMLQAIHERMEGRLDEEVFHSTADDAVRLAVGAQLRAGADVVTDGEQRRDNYASFVGARLDNC
jgi:5-methyltetrahydropteroyltriglutamate--homocysteine methyltransferase